MDLKIIQIPVAFCFHPRELKPISGIKIAKYLASCHDAMSMQIPPLLESPHEHWGKIQWLQGGT
jgi:hypothetical protein